MKVKLKLEEEERVSYHKVIKLKIDNEEYSIDFKNLKGNKVCLLKKDVTLNNNFLEIVKEDDFVIYLFVRKNNLYITRDLNRVYRRKAHLFSSINKKYTKFFGLYSDISNRFDNADKIFLNEKEIGVIKRPFKNIPKLKHFAIIRIPNQELFESGEVHNTIRIGASIEKSLVLKLKKKHKGINYYSKKRIKDKMLFIRSTVSSGSVRVVSIPMQPEYKFINLFKNKLAYLLSKFIGTKRIVLMFEKESYKANESGYYIFDKIMKTENVKSKVYFVIDKSSPYFNDVYNAHKKNILKKYSFKHYLYIYISNYFISSELSNHVINPRLYIKSLNDALKKKPLIFLQHGIMFAKPVDNPAAAGFRKDNGSVLFYKCIVSSDLEATQFYRLGFNDDDLIKCGLTKFDISYQVPEADKIMFMPTYRYWEEAMVMNPNTIKETTYYKNYMNVINKFKDAGLLDRLSISCHPKFADCLLEADPIYESIIEKDINKGLENAKIFITDYSSASYDAHYRGAYIIYYWAEKDYLIENYKAIPPVDETNCDGVPVYDIDSLIKEVKNAISKNYKMDKKYENRYRKINEFHDGHNGDRLIKELIKLEII